MVKGEYFEAWLAMNLSAKIFLGYLTFAVCLLGFSIYVIRYQTEAHEIARIEEALTLAHLEFQESLENYQQGILKLVRAITMEQKFRSFLSQIKDNYYPFAEELALDAGGDIVFMVDDLRGLGGIYPATDHSHAWIKAHLQAFQLTPVFDHGQPSSSVISLDHELFSAVYVPLKEALADDYAVGVIVACKRMDDEWINSLFGRKLKSFGIRALFFTNGSPVAGNVSPDEASRIMTVVKGKEVGTGSYVFSGERYIARTTLFEGAGSSVRGGYVLSSSLDQALQPFRALQQTILVIGLLTLLVGLVSALVFAKRIVRPLRLLVAGTKEVAQGNYDVHVECAARDEVGELAEAFNHMMEDLREKERIRGSLAKYEQRVQEQVGEIERMGRLKGFFSPELAEMIVSSDSEDVLKSHRREVVVVFLDLRGFTAFSETVEPEEVMGMLGEYHGEMGQLIVEYQATLERFTGDGMMIFFNDPVPIPNAAEKAVRMAVAMRERAAAKLRAKWVKQGYDLGFGIGIASGYATLGAIGFEGRRDYGAIGVVTNLAARLCGEAQAFQILVSQRFLYMVEDLVVSESVGELTLKGFHHSITAYNILRLRE